MVNLDGKSKFSLDYDTTPPPPPPLFVMRDGMAASQFLFKDSSSNSYSCINRYRVPFPLSLENLLIFCHSGHVAAF